MEDRIRSPPLQCVNRFCRKFQFWGQNPKTEHRQFNDLQTTKLSKKQICDRAWRKHTEPFLPEEERLFHTKMNSKTVWVIEDGAAFTLMMSSRAAA